MSKVKDVWIEPRNVEEARRIADEFMTDIQKIQCHLTNKNVTKPDGTRMSEKEYWEWREKAKHALLMRQQKYRRVKTWIREHQNLERATEFTGTIDPRDPRALLSNLLRLTRRIVVSTAYQLSDDEQAVLDVVRDYFQDRI